MSRRAARATQEEMERAGLRQARSATMLEERTIADLLGEALRRHRHGQMRPLWIDMPEGPEKQRWREKGRAQLDFNSVLGAAKRRADEAERNAAERREPIRKGARRSPNGFRISSNDEESTS